VQMLKCKGECSKKCVKGDSSSKIGDALAC